ncbi:DUF4124 domain-containing protein [Alkalimarinus alittae]|uniref:DUF4124 domain-containing protein n=1 Tax=Alkalimarinus alittae TaxID=2961619 RepID=A0ABY6N2V0_9ALTE|nr:DUF4124 domain-containing protein [Alkalimarinus alittae]UZE96426.1 DUF4124 domain-containing protein [Alkalimarinus alittae]
MKWIYRIVTAIILIGAITIPFMMKNKQGEPMMSLPNIDDLSPSEIISNVPSLPSDRTVYKWKDATGVWHYGDQPPEGVKFSTLVVNDQTNIIQSTPILEVTAPLPKTATDSDRGNTPTYTPPQSNEDTLTLDRALNIVDDAHAVRDMMEQRNKQLEALTRNTEKK